MKLKGKSCYSIYWDMLRVRTPSFFMLTKINSLRRDWENTDPGTLCIMKANVRHRQKKAIFYFTKIFHNAIYDLAALKTLVKWVKYFSIDFFWRYNFFWSTAFLIVFHFCPLLKGVLVKINYWFPRRRKNRLVVLDFITKWDKQYYKVWQV